LSFTNQYYVVIAKQASGSAKSYPLMVGSIDRATWSTQPITFVI